MEELAVSTPVVGIIRDLRPLPDRGPSSAYLEGELVRLRTTVTELERKLQVLQAEVRRLEARKR